MCFSATSSFVVTAGLTVTGAVALKNVSKKNMIPLALIPLGFALQQTAEGIAWLTLDQQNSFLHKLGMYGFLTFAYVVWPVWIPFSIKVYEHDRTRKMLLSLVQIIGLLFSITAAFIVWTTPASISVISGSLAYNIPHFLFSHASALSWYIIATVLPFFIASNRYILKLLGTMLVLSLAVSYFFSRRTLPSVWCFFAAVISLGVLGIIWSERKKS